MPSFDVADFSPAAAKVLESYLHDTDTALPGFLTGVYVYGSLSLGDFRPQKSDVDFVAVTSRHPSPDEIRKLGAIHLKLRLRFLRTDLNGLYIEKENLAKVVLKTNRFLCFQNGFKVSKNLHENNLVTWYQLKINAITLRGNAPKEFPYEVTMHDLRTEMRQNLNTYWTNWIARHSRVGPAKLLLLTLPQKTEWGVLGISRQWYTLETGQITSKTGAGKYCLLQFSDRYRDILETALAVRDRRHAPIRSGIKRASATLDYMKFLVRTFNQRYENLYANR